MEFLFLFWVLRLFCNFFVERVLKYRRSVSLSSTRDSAGTRDLFIFVMYVVCYVLKFFGVMGVFMRCIWCKCFLVLVLSWVLSCFSVFSSTTSFASTRRRIYFLYVCIKLKIIGVFMFLFVCFIIFVLIFVNLCLCRFCMLRYFRFGGSFGYVFECANINFNIVLFLFLFLGMLLLLLYVLILIWYCV